MGHSTEVARSSENITGGPALRVSALMCVPYVGAAVAAIIAMRFFAVVLVASPVRAVDIALLGAFSLAYAAVVHLAQSNLWVMAAGTFVVSLAAQTVLSRRLESMR